MAANKEAIALVLDVGPSMNQAPPGEATALQTSLDAITMILQRKMFAESKDEVALILFGTADTDNPLSDGESYENITIARHLGIADFELLEQVQNDIQASNISGDFVDAIVVAMDHLEASLQGKKGFASKRLILMSNLDGEFGDDQVDTISAAIKNSGTELNVIGPDLEDDDDEDQPGPSSGANGHRKAKTAQQRAGEAMIKHLLEDVDGECYSFSEALPALSYFQTRQVRPTAWKCQLEISAEVKIPICGYVKVKDFKAKQSWKRVYARDPNMEVGTLRTYHRNDEEETEVEKEDVVEGHCYGNTLVPMTEDDKLNMKYRSEKCFKVLGFTASSNVKRHCVMGDGVLAVIGEKGDETAEVALSAVINALFDTDMVAIVRRVYNAASGPKIGCLVPHIKNDYECLHYFELPFMEDVRQFTFGTLPLKADNPSNKYKPSADQLAAMDSLIDNMDLSTAAVDDKGEPAEAMKPKLTFNPYFQRLYQCLQHRALNPDDPLPELSPLIADALKPPQEVLVACQENTEKLKKKFKLEVVKKKEEKTGEDLFKENSSAGGEPSAKRQKLDENLDGGMEDMTKAKVTKVGSATPVEDFLAIINRKDEDMFEEACVQMQKRIDQIVTDSFGEQFYEKALDCLTVLRQQCIKKSEPGSYNTFIQQFKDSLIVKARRDFLEKIYTAKQGLISKLECEDSAVSEVEAKKFYAGEEDSKVEEPVEEEDSDDLLGEL